MGNLSAIKKLTQFNSIFHLPFYKYTVIDKPEFKNRPYFDLENQLEKSDSLKVWFIKKENNFYERYFYYSVNDSEIYVKLNDVNKLNFGYKKEFIDFWSNKGPIGKDLKIYNLFNKWKQPETILSKTKYSQNKLTF